MKHFINKIFITGVIALWWGVFVTLILSHTNPLQITNILGFSFLVIVPGFLTLLVLNIKRLELWGYLNLIIGMSLLEIIGVILLGNTILPIFGYVRPLDTIPLIYQLTSLIGGLLLLFWFRTKQTFKLSKIVFFENTFNLFVSFVPILFVLMSILGAVTLNNGGVGTITLIMLVLMGLYFALLVNKSDQLGENVIPTGLFFTSMALLFMTSLRGWYITGHDVETEFRVFQLAKTSGIWNIESFKDAYNACMSITILPTVFSNLLKLSDPYIYKVLFQIIFATVPTTIYLVSKRYLSSGLALISTLFFVAFPTFANDMPMLNRQEVAFVFLALMIYLIFEEQLAITMRRVLFVVFGVGMVLSHYSTTYSVIALFGFMVVARPIAERIIKMVRNVALFKKSGLTLFKVGAKITLPMVFILIIVSFLWSSVLTNTSSESIYKVISQTIQVIVSNTKKDARSSDVEYSLLSTKQLDPKQEFIDYQNNVVIPTRAKTNKSTLYEETAYQKYPLNVLTQSTLPITELGQLISRIGVPVTTINYITRQASAKILQVLVILGFVYILFKNWFLKKPIHTEFLLLSVGSLAFVLSIVVLPVLSVEYGLLRAFEQSLMFLGVFITTGSLFLASGIKKNLRVWVPAFLAIIFMWTQTGVFSQLLGGYYGQLNLNNSGAYYDTYYLHTGEVLGIKWLRNNIISGPNQPEIQADKSMAGKIESNTTFHTLHDIYPGLVLTYSYVVLGYQNVHSAAAPVTYNGDTLTYQYPLSFLDEHKNLLYNNGDLKIYK